jgi:uncharacterized membrane protein YcjF (UPF0283 family)
MTTNSSGQHDPAGIDQRNALGVPPEGDPPLPPKAHEKEMPPTSKLPVPSSLSESDQHGAGDGIDQRNALGMPPEGEVHSIPVASEESLLNNRPSLLMGENTGDENPDDKFGRLVGIEKVAASKYLKCALIILGSCLGLVLFAQTISLVNQLIALPAWARYLGFTGLLALVVAFVWASIEIGRVFIKFQQTPGPVVDGFMRLSEVSHLQKEGIRATDRARDQLERYLLKYPIGEDNKSVATAEEFTEEDIKSLVNRRKDLLEGQAARAGNQAWIQECSDRFVKLIDKRAEKVIEFYAKRVGFMTAVARTGLVDSLIVIIQAYRMVRDLFVIYNVRLSRIGAFAVVIRTMISALAAAHMEDLTEGMVKKFTEWANSSLKASGLFIPGGEIGANVVSGGISRVSEGAVNYILFRRIGKSTIRHLRPLPVRIDEN